MFPEARCAARRRSLNGAKPLKNHHRVVGQREVRSELFKHLSRGPEPFVTGSPFGDRGIAFTLVKRVLKSYLTKADDGDGGCLEHQECVAL